MALTQIFLGIEAIDEEGLQKVRKRIPLGRNFEALEFARSLGLYVAINLIADPDWDRERFRVVRDWCMDVPEVVNISINTPYPGTETWLTEQRRLQTRDYRLFDIQHAVLPTKLPLDVFYRELLDTQWVLYRKHMNWRTTPKLARVLVAVRPGLATTQGPLILASSPYAKRGVLWDTHRLHFGKDGDPLILVAQGASRDFNPTLSQSVVDRALERDHVAASAEYLAEFRSDIEGFVSHEVVRACVGGHHEMAPLAQNRYYAFVDPSGGSGDSMTMAVAHKEGDRVVIDGIHERKPPFNPETVVDDFAVALESYRVTRVVGDRYAGEWPREQFRKRGIGYVCSEKVKSDLYRDLLPTLNSGRIVLPKSERLVSQLCGLERRTARSGKDSIDHGPGSHDDLANAVAGAADLIALAQRQLDTGGGVATYGTVID